MFDDQICNVDSSISIFCENPPCCTSCFLPLQHPQLLPSRHCLVNFGVSAFNLAMVDRNYGNSWMGNMMENMMGLVLTMWENNGTIMKKMGGFLWEFLVFYEKKWELTWSQQENIGMGWECDSYRKSTTIGKDWKSDDSRDLDPRSMNCFAWFVDFFLQEPGFVPPNIGYLLFFHLKQFWDRASSWF